MSGQEWEGLERVDGLVTAVGEMRPGPKMEADSEAAKWLPLPGLGGRWQMAGGQGRTSAVLAVAGRVWAPISTG